MVPLTTPRELLYIETRLLDMQSNIQKNRINYVNRLEKMKKDILGKITKEVGKKSLTK